MSQKSDESGDDLRVEPLDEVQETIRDLSQLSVPVTHDTRT